MTYKVVTKTHVVGTIFTWSTFAFDTHRKMIEFTSLNPEYEVEYILGGIYGMNPPKRVRG